MTMLPTAKKLSFDSIPVIDLAPLDDGTEESRREVAERVVQACGRVGFMYIQNHGVPQEALDAIFQTSRDFHDLPLEAKMEVSVTLNDHSQGYLPGRRMGTANMQPNLQEAFQFRRPLADDDPDMGKPMHGKIPWPSAMPDLQPRMMSYFDQVNLVAYKLLDLFEVGLDMAPGTLKAFHQKDMNMLRILHYPPQAPDTTDPSLGARAHTDTNTLTVLLQDPIGGLEILNGEGEWVAAPPIPGTLVVNVGEVLKVWTDGIMSSTRHRVINRSGKERYSVPFFLYPSYDAVIQPLLTNPDPSNVAPEDLHTSMPRDQPFVYGEFKTAHTRKLQPGKATAEY
jgi:isopenicillin N synthase-like dioxygenase